MNTHEALSMGYMSRGREPKVFDWVKAARIIRESGKSRARAGLQGDWDYTGGVIYQDGEPVKETCTYLSSTWAIPELLIGGKLIECWLWEKDSHGWDAYTEWPDEALEALKGS